MEVLNHFSHKKHPLILIEVDDTREEICYGCFQLISPDPTCYGCSDCQFFLHKACAELPTQIQYPTHSQHPLKLFGKKPYLRCFCNVCSNEWGGFTYHCSECSIDVDILCAKPELMKLEHIRHKAHLHPLILTDVDDKRKVICKGCYQLISSPDPTCYGCSHCKFFLHKSCAELPTQIQYPTHSQHPLELLAETPDEEEPESCSVCRKWWDGFAYRCKLCEFDVDILCAKPELMKPEHIWHECHHHPLILGQVPDVDGDENEVVKCRVCKERISAAGPAYGCFTCGELYIHKVCAELPNEIEFYLHPQHPLKLYKKEKRSSCACDVCGKATSAYIYHCQLCGFDVDLSCARLDRMKIENIMQSARSYPLILNQESGREVVALNHFSHQNHPLILREVDDERKVICKGCYQLISSPDPTCYGCSDCEFFLHKSCAELPTQIQYATHSQHPLRLFAQAPYYTGICSCNVCSNEWESFTYHCKICQFDVDILCAKPELIKPKHIRHECHYHPLILGQVPDVDGEENEIVNCRVCNERISSAGQAYVCFTCQVYIHKACAELRDEIEFYLHSEHPLELYRKEFFIESACDVCDKEISALMYQCKLCNFAVHLSCARLDRMKIENIMQSARPHALLLIQERGREVVALNHFSHEKHPLILRDVQEYEENDEDIWCYGCNELIWSGPAYGCRECKVFLHKVCAELPTKISHPSHPDHQLKLFRKPRIQFLKCDVCESSKWDGFTYLCLRCNFSVDISCSHPEVKTLKTVLFTDKHVSWKSHPFHPQHPLQLVSRPASFKCDACRTIDKEDESYKCTQCQFWLHKTCASYPLVSEEFIKHHDHPLSLAYSLPEEYRHFQFNCDICCKWISPMYWVYYCQRCRYFVHLKCFRRKIQEDLDGGHSISNLELLDDATFEEKLLGALLLDHLVQLPAINVSVELIHPFLLQKTRFLKEKEIKSLIYHEHPLILFTKQITSMDIEDEDIVCDGCTEPVNAPYYGCVDCNYYLHQACLHLPAQLQHPNHPQHPPLQLITKTRFEIARLFYGTPGYLTNGFFYKCDLCDYEIDLKCAAAQPNIVLHKAHNNHPLFQVKDPFVFARTCKACRSSSVNDHQGYSCQSCDFFVHYKCAMLPATVRHRWDRKHPLVLSFPPHSDHPDDFICDLCEEEIHPEEWIYLCLECDLSFHPRCVPGVHNELNRKYGQRLSISSHPHPLNYCRDAIMKKLCDGCSGEIYQSVFECDTCYFSLCRHCVHKE